MALTEERKEYLIFLKYSIEDTEVAVGVALLTKTFEQERQMFLFIRDNPEATDQEILAKAIEINRRF